MSAELEFKIMHMLATSKNGKITAFAILKVASSFNEANETIYNMIENNQLSMFHDDVFVDIPSIIDHDIETLVKMLLLSQLTHYTEYQSCQKI